MFFKKISSNFHKHPFFWLSVLTSVVVVAVLLPFLLRPGFLVFGDVTEGILSQNVANKYFWTFDDNVGPTLVEKSRLPLFAIFWGLFEVFKLPSEALVKVKILTLFVLSIWAFIAAIKLTRKHFSDDSTPPSPPFLLATLLGTLAFLFNPWMMNRLNHFFLYFGSVNLPLIFALYLDFLLVHTSSLKKLIGLLLIVAITSATPHIIVIEGLVMLIMTGVVLVFSPERAAILRRIGLVSVIGLIGGVLLNAYWLLPYLSSLRDASAAPDKVLTLEVLRLLAQYDQLFNTVRLLGYWWPSTKYFMDWSPVLRVLGIAGSLVLPVFFVAYTSFGIKKLAVKVVGVAAIVAVFLCSYTPLSESFYNYLMFYSPLASFGWVWREIDKIGLVLVFLFSLTFVYLVTTLLQHRFYLPVVLSFVLLAVFCYPHTAFTLYYDFAPQYVPKAFFLADDYLAADRSNFNVVWYPKVVDPVWAGNSDEPGNFAIYSSSEPALGYSSDTQSLLDYALKPENAARVNEAKFLQLLGVKYLVVREDARSTSQAPLVAILNNQPELKRVAQFDFLTVYENLRFKGLVSAKTSQVVSTLGLETFKYLDDLQIDPGNTALTLTDGLAGYQPAPGKPKIPTTKILLENGDITDLTMTSLDEYFMYPFDYTFRGDTNRYWSRATALDQIHGELTPLLAEEKINNQQLDFRGGVVVASDQRFFKDEGAFGALASSQASSLPVTFGFGTVSREVVGPTFNFFRRAVAESPYWQISTSREMSASAGQSFYLQFNTDKSDYSAETNVRLQFYNQNRELLKTWYALPDYNQYQGVATAPPETSFLTVELLARPKYDLALGSFRLLDVTDKVSRLALSFKAPLACSANCQVWVRTLDSQAGSGLRFKLDSTIFDLNTYSSYNRFNWHYLGKIMPLSSSVTVELTNLGGFEAVNALAIVPEEAFATAQKTTAQLLNQAQSFIITNPDTAVPSQNGHLGLLLSPVSWPISYPTAGKYEVTMGESQVSDNLVTLTPSAVRQLNTTLKIDADAVGLLKMLAPGSFKVVGRAPSATDWLTVSSASFPVTGGHDYVISGTVSGTGLRQLHLKAGEQIIVAGQDGDLAPYTFKKIVRLSDWSRPLSLSLLIRGDAVGALFTVSDLTVEEIGAVTASPTILAEVRPLREIGGIGKIGLIKNDPTSYTVSLAATSSAQLLSFAKPFNLGWQLQGSTAPFLTDVVLNGWLIPASQSGSLKITFGPQAYFVWGAIVSLVTAVGVGGLYLVLRKRVE